jgi:hypothetical protein
MKPVPWRLAHPAVVAVVMAAAVVVDTAAVAAATVVVAAVVVKAAVAAATAAVAAATKLFSRLDIFKDASKKDPSGSFFLGLFNVYLLFDDLRLYRFRA